MGFLPVTNGHTIYYEVHGKGRPALALHGGPGGGMQHSMLAPFDLTKWRVVLFDQRGCGKSTPFGSLAHNTTWDLVDDIEALRVHLGVETWFVSGGSWGSTLALAYAEKHPSKASGLLLRGLCLCDEASFRWLYEQGGASEVFPDAWSGFIDVLPMNLRMKGWRSIAKYYQRKLKGKEAQRYANAWWNWESAISFLRPRNDDTTAKERISLSTIENHYFVNDCWLKKNELLHGLDALRHIPITIVQGRYDMVCPMSGAYAVKKALSHVRLLIVPDAGHASIEPGTKKALSETLRSYSRRSYSRRSYSRRSFSTRKRKRHV